MRSSHILCAALSAVLIPALAFADDQAPPAPAAPSAPQAPQAPQTPQTPQTPVAPTTTSSQQPVVVVNPNQPAPPAAVPVYANPESDVIYDRWNAPVFTSGALVFGASYAAALVADASSDHVGADRLAVPVLGPWLALAQWGNCPVSSPSCDTNTTDKVLLVADGIFQAAGVITIVDSLLDPSRHSMIAHTADKGVHVTPTGNGFAVLGKF